MQDRSLYLEIIGPKTFSIDFSWSDKAIILGWFAETSMANIIWMRLITIRWGWPPVRCVECFTDVD